MLIAMNNLCDGLTTFLKEHKTMKLSEMKPVLDALFETAFNSLMAMPELLSREEVSMQMNLVYGNAISGRRYRPEVKDEVDARLIKLLHDYQVAAPRRPVPPPAPVLAMPPMPPMSLMEGLRRAPEQAIKKMSMPPTTRPAGPPHPPAQAPKMGGVMARTMARLRGKSSAPGAGADAAAGSSVGAGAGAGSATAVVSAFTPSPPATSRLNPGTTHVTLLSGVKMPTQLVMNNPFLLAAQAAAAEAAAAVAVGGAEARVFAERQSVRADVPDSPATVRSPHV